MTVLSLSFDDEQMSLGIYLDCSRDIHKVSRYLKSLLPVSEADGQKKKKKNWMNHAGINQTGSASESTEVLDSGFPWGMQIGLQGTSGDRRKKSRNCRQDVEVIFGI